MFESCLQGQNKLCIGALFVLLCALGFAAEETDLIRMHAIAHSHNDLGWKSTINEYYTGTSPFGCVKCIYDGVLDALAKNPSYTFQVVEIGFFRLWWDDVDEEKRDTMKKLVRDGQIEFLNGGIAMNDEACPYYEMIIDQYALGQQWIKEHFDYYPKSGWSVDPFGHSKAHAWILAKMGYDSQTMERVHSNVVEMREKTKTMNFLWKPWSEFEETIFSQITDFPYWHGPRIENWQTCHTVSCGSRLTDNQYNLYKEWNQNRAEYFLTNNIEHHMGGDFLYSYGAGSLLRKVNLVVDQISNTTDNFEAVWSSFAKYVNMTHKDYVENSYLGATEPNKLTIFEDDLFPYVSDPDAAWTGYFTTKPVLKGFAYDSLRYLLSLKTLYSKMLLSNAATLQLTKKNIDEVWSKLWLFDEAVGIVTHHDGITGTAKARVDKEDYFNRLAREKSSSDKVLPR